MNIKDISHLDVITMEYVKKYPNTYVFRKINKLEIREPATKKEIPWYNDKGAIETAMNFKCDRKPAIALMIAAYTIAKMFGAKIKWPNDIILGGKKVAGMMLVKHGDRYIFGSGINLNRKIFNKEISEKATSYINQYQKKWPEADFAVTFVKNYMKNLKTVNIRDIEDMQIFKNKVMNIDGKVYKFLGLNNDGSANWEIDGQKEVFKSFTLSFTKHYHLFNK